MAQGSRTQQAAAPTVFHPYLHMRNMFVSEKDPTHVTAFINWQSASIEPAFWYAGEIPDFARGSELRAKTFEVCTRFLTPKLSGPRSLNDSLFRPFRYCYGTWHDGTVAFRHELIESSKQWIPLEAGSYPFIVPNEEGLAIHGQEYKKAAHDLKSGLASLLDITSDGWVLPQEWESKNSAQREFVDKMLQAVLSNEDQETEEPIRSEEDLKGIWPYDI